MNTNGHVRRARTRKVRRLCSAAREVARGLHPPATAWEAANWLEGAPTGVWLRLASYAGTRYPSEETRSRVVHALRRYRYNRKGHIPVR
jgi:hypothetical protein